MTNTNKNRRGLRWAFVLAFLFVNSVVAFAQSTVTDVVKDDLGEPLAGTKVQVKGTNNVVMTDANGKFSIRANKGQSLVFSFVGFSEKTVAVDGKPMNIMMAEDAKTLNDVVVIGYGSLARKEVASSITSLRPQDMDIAVVTSPEQMLQGKVPGLVITNTSDPNGQASISLRGASSLREGAAMEPYYVVDGVPGVSMSLVSPDDIESIDVLRDASATAIYGSKAANGVIIVTTKKGSKSGRTSVTYSGYVAADKAMKTLDMMSGTQLLDFANKAGYDLSTYYDAANPSNTDWQKEGMRTAFTHNHSISINGGHNKTSYSASLSYLDKDGVVRGSDMNHLTARTFLQTSFLKDHIDLSISLNGSVKNNHSNQSVDGSSSVGGTDAIDAMYYYNPLVPVYNADGSYYENLSVSQNFNPMSIINEDRYNTNEKMLQGVGKLTAHIIEGLDLNMNFSYQNKQWTNNNYNSSKSQIYKSDHGRATRYTITDIDKQMETYANYTHTWKDKHKLSLMAGFSWEQQDHNDGFGLTAYNFYDDALLYYNMGMANKLDLTGIYSYQLSTLRMISFYARANYAYDNRYLFQATIRRDGSSAFGANNRWATFPSFSAAWRVTEEKFMKNQNIFDDLKFRIGYGVSGNSLGFDAYTALLTYGWYNNQTFVYNGDTYKTLAATKNANADLKWERTGMFNIGLDMEFLNGRLGGTIEYYYKKTKDLIYPYTVSQVLYPYGSMTANVGEISNKGVELTINAIPVQGREFQWNTTFTLSHNKNTVEKLTSAEYSRGNFDQANPDIGGFSSETIQRLIEGKPIGQFYMTEWVGFDDNGQSLYNDYDNDGNLIGTTTTPGAEDKREVGNAQPKVTFSWSNTLTWKKWSLSASFQGVGGNKIFNAKKAYYSSMTNVKNGKNGLTSLYEQVLDNPNTINDTYSQFPSTRYLEKGSYFRLSALTLGYDFGRLGDWIQNLRLYATVNNVFTITGYDGNDPEINLGGLAPGIDWRQSTYPRTRTYLFGVNINF